jgi:hypothetical protein
MGLQGAAMKAFFRSGDLKWVYVGCIIPDVPWIIQRIFMASPMPINLYDLRLYSVAQAAFFSCVILSLSLAMVSRRTGCVFLILSVNSLLHLLVDACEIKWGNGVHLLAPLHWEMVNFGLFWPNGTFTHILTAVGLIFVVLMWHRSIREFKQKLHVTLNRGIAALLLFVVYIMMPFVFSDALERINSHYVHTFRHYGERAGKPVVLDRVPYQPGDKGGTIRVFGEDIHLHGFSSSDPVLLSIKGVFETPDLLTVRAVHVHPRFMRSAASYIGLGLALGVWVGYLVRRRLPP